MIERAAADGSGYAHGTRVVGLVDAGAWAQLAAIPTGRLTPIPNGVTDAHAATLPTAGLTALRALELAGLVLGKRVLGHPRNRRRRADRDPARTRERRPRHRTRPRCRSSPRTPPRSRATDVVETLAGDFDLIIDGVGGGHLRPRHRVMSPRAASS